MEAGAVASFYYQGLYRGKLPLPKEATLHREHNAIYWDWAGKGRYIGISGLDKIVDPAGSDPYPPYLLTGELHGNRYGEQVPVHIDEYSWDNPTIETIASICEYTKRLFFDDELNGYTLWHVANFVLQGCVESVADA